MVVCCCVCKIYQEVRDTERSFHTFPKSETKKNEWLTALGLHKVANSAVVCSDHFSSEDFSAMQQPGEIIRRRLNKQATPYKNLTNTKENVVQTTHNEKAGSSETVQNLVKITAGAHNQQKQDMHTSVLNTLTCNTNNNHVPNSNVPDHSTQRMGESQFDELEITESSCEMNLDCRNMSQKRKAYSVTDPVPVKEVSVETRSDKRRAMPQKQIRLQLEQGYFETFSQRDFTSNQKWIAFQKYVQYTRKRLQTHAKRRSRRSKRFNANKTQST